MINVGVACVGVGVGDVVVVAVALVDVGGAVALLTYYTHPELVAISMTDCQLPQIPRILPEPPPGIYS